MLWLVGLPILTLHRAMVWQTDLSLWTDATVWSASPRAWIDLGAAQYRRLSEATATSTHIDQIDGWAEQARVTFIEGRRLARDRGWSDAVAVADLDLALMEHGAGRDAAARWYLTDARGPRRSEVERLCQLIGCD